MMQAESNSKYGSARERIHTKKEVERERQQYTLKGVETEAVELMRLAASSQGVKIGHWVSERLKEAAKRALDDTDRHRNVLKNLVEGSEGSGLRTLSLSDSAMSRAELEERVRRLELEVQEMLRFQRDTLGILLGKII
jgi:uncharacterized protein YfeS